MSKNKSNLHKAFKQLILNKYLETVVNITKNHVDLLEIKFGNKFVKNIDIDGHNFQIKRVAIFLNVYEYFLTHEKNNIDLTPLKKMNLHESHFLFGDKKIEFVKITDQYLEEYSYSQSSEKEKQEFKQKVNDDLAKTSKKKNEKLNEVKDVEFVSEEKLEKTQSYIENLNDLEEQDKKLEIVFKKQNIDLTFEKPQKENKDYLYTPVDLKDAKPLEAIEAKTSEEAICDEYKNRYKKLLNIKPNSIYRNLDFFDLDIIAGRLKSCFDSNSSFWFITDLNYKSVDSMWNDLKAKYCSKNPREIDSLIKEVKNNSQSLISFQQYQKHISVGSTTTFTDKLKNKINELREKDKYIDDYLEVLKNKLSDAGIVPDKNEEFLEVLAKKGEIHKCIEMSKTNLERFESRLDAFLHQYADFQLSFYINIYGKDLLISKYDEIIGEKLLDLNQQVNEIVFYHSELEKKLVEKIDAIHNAKKIKSKIQFFEQDDYLRDFLKTKSKSQKQIDAEKRKKFLSEVGQLHESTAQIQQRINEEYQKVNYYLSNLKTIENVPDYEKRLLEIKSQKSEINRKKKHLQKYVRELKHKVDLIESSNNDFMSQINLTVANFHNDIMDTYKKHQESVNDSVNKLWDKWLNEGGDLIGNIFNSHHSLISEFSDLALCQVKNIHERQKSLLKQAKQRQDKWEQMFKTMMDEFKALGYVKKGPSINAVFAEKIEAARKKTMTLSENTKQLLYYQPNFAPSQVQNHLIGLDPKMLNDDNFYVIDQVWAQLTEEQEQLLRAQAEKEAKIKDEENIKIKHAELKRRIYEKLENERYQFRKNNIIDCLPVYGSDDSTQRRIADYEKQILNRWKEQKENDSSTRAQFKESIFNFAKKLFSVNKVEVNNSDISISDTGYAENDPTVEKLSEKDYFTKTVMTDFETHGNDMDVSFEETDIYDLYDENLVEIVDSLNDVDTFDQKFNGPKKPTLEEWAQISIKKFREKRKGAELVDIKGRLAELDKEIEKISKVHFEHKDLMSTEITKRNYLYDDIQTDVMNMKQFLISKEDELDNIITQIKQEIDEKFSEKLD